MVWVVTSWRVSIIRVAVLLRIWAVVLALWWRVWVMSLVYMRYIPEWIAIRPITVITVIVITRLHCPIWVLIKPSVGKREAQNFRVIKHGMMFMQHTDKPVLHDLQLEKPKPFQDRW